MNKYLAVTMALGLIGVSGCATTEETEAYRKYQATRDAGRETLVGSRLVKPTTERMVNAVGNNEYNQYNQHTGMANKSPQAN